MSGQIGHFRFPTDDDSAENAPLAPRTDPPAPPVGDNGARPANKISPLRSKLSGASPTTWGWTSTAGFCCALLALSVSPYYGREVIGAGPAEDCRNVTDSALHRRCVDKATGYLAHTHLYWNAWRSWFSWPAIVLFLIVAAVVAFKAVFGKSEKVVLSRQVRLALVLADLLFLVSFFHIPHDNAGRAWGLWLSLIVVIAINIGVLLATTEVGEWIAEHWPERAKKTTANPEPPPQSNVPQQTDYRPTPQAMPPGHRHPNWPPPSDQQQAGLQRFPTSGQPQFPPNEQR